MSTPQTKFNDPDYQCKAYLDMMGDMDLVRDVMGGTKIMRQRGALYLPKHPKEEVAEFNLRVYRSVLFNPTEKTHGAFEGLVYKEEPKLKDSVPSLIREHWENIDLAGNHGAVFTKEVFGNAIRDGHAFMLVDMAKPVARQATRADELGRRPYWLSYTKDQARNWTTDRINGEEILTQITFREEVYQRKGRFGERKVTRHRVIFLPQIESGLNLDGVQISQPVYDPVAWELYNEDKDAPEGSKFRLVDGGQTNLTRIPLGVSYGKRTGFLQSEPLLLDLAYLNIDWWQQNSDYRTQLNKLVPVIVRKGLTPEQIKAYGPHLTLGAGLLVDIPGGDCDLFFRSHDPGALEPARRALLDTEQRMAMSGLSIIAQRTGSDITATEVKENKVERTSELSTAARSHRDAIEYCLGFHAQFLNIESRFGDGGAVELGVQESSLVVDPQILTTLNQMISERRFTLEGLFAYMQGGLKAVDFETIIKEVSKLPPIETPKPPPSDDDMEMEEMEEEKEVVQ